MTFASGSSIPRKQAHVVQLFIMAEDEPQQRDLAGSSATFPTDSENYDSSNNDLSPSPPSSSRSPMILYSPPTIWGLLRGAAINLLLPFVNGLMLGFGELLAHEAAFRLGWSGTKVCTRLGVFFCLFPMYREILGLSTRPDCLRLFLCFSKSLRY